MEQMMLSAQPTPAMQSQEELAALFSRNLVLNPELQHVQQQQLPQRSEFEQNQFSGPQAQAAAPIIYSISQHYHHSTHIPRQQPEQQQQPQRGASEPPLSEQESCEEELRRHGVDTAALGPSQVQLFRTGAPEQKARLVELWKICPPANREANPALAFTSTTMEQEEQLARLQYERQQQGCMKMDCAGLQSASGRWDAEPYMQSGYEELMRREAEAGQRLADRPKDAYSQFGVAIAGPRDQEACSFSRATEPVYGVENRYVPQAGEGLVSWQGVSRIHAPAGTADAMEIL